MSYLCSADCIEDINYLGRQFSLRPKTHVPSADTVGRALKNLAVEDTVYNCPESRKSYRFNTAEKLNELMLRMIRHLGLVKPNTEVDLDFDHQFIAAHKYDAKYSYKQDYGYFPGWAMVGGIFVGGANNCGSRIEEFRSRPDEEW